MLSDLLLSAKGVKKSYSNTMRPIAQLKHALFGRPPLQTETYEVLQNVDLDIFRGQTVGIMGRNGAGKTTLLGILGNVIEPDSGKISRNCRIATLLDLSAGFNPNFTGRENAYLFCSIQGISKRETDERMDSISAFADLGRYFDLPLRTYSSGMQARLGFACAIHVDAEMIIIDEILAVGDAGFRLKCYERIKQMQNLSKTFLITSHNQNLVANFCTRAIVLERGAKVFDGSTLGAVEEYKRIRVASEQNGNGTNQSKAVSHGRDSFLSEKLLLDTFSYKAEMDPNDGPIGIIEARLVARDAVQNPAISFGIRNHQGIVLGSYDTSGKVNHLPQLAKGECATVKMRFSNILLPGTYFVSAATYELVGDVKVQTSLHSSVLRFEVVSAADMSGLVNLKMSISLTRKIREHSLAL
jgi:ABC-type polysaccharide/polyol phosphate transport system ATPase subunit